MSPRRKTEPPTREHSRSSSSGGNGLIAKDKTKKQSARKRTALDNRFHRTDKALSVLLNESVVEFRGGEGYDGGRSGAGSGVRKERVERNRARYMGIQSVVLGCLPQQPLGLVFQTAQQRESRTLVCGSGIA